MGNSVYVTITTKEYALLQRIVGEGSTDEDGRRVFDLYQCEVETLKHALREYEGRYGQ